MTRSEQIEAAARALRKVMMDYPGRYLGHPVYALLIAELDHALDLPADAEPVAWIAYDLSGRPLDFRLGSAHPVRDAAPDATVVKYAGGWHPTYASPPSPDRTQAPDGYETVHVGSGLPLATCPCGLCVKNRAAAPVAAQADALAALKELVACEELFDSVAYRAYRGTIDPDQLTNDRIELKSRQPLAWAEARRVIDATSSEGGEG